MNERELDNLIAQFYQAAAGLTSWQLPLGKLAGALGLWAANLFGLDKQKGGLLFHHIAGLHPPASNLDFIRTYHRIDPRFRTNAIYSVGKWMHCHEHLDEDFVAHDPFYQEFLLPYGGRYVSAVKLHEDDQSIIIFGAHRGVGMKPVGPVELAVLDRIRLHLAEALRIYLHLRDSLAELPAGRQILQSFQYPMALLDTQRSIRFANAACERALGESDYIVNRAGTLACRDPAGDAELLAAITELQLHAEFPGSNAEKRFVRAAKASSGAIVGIHVIAIRPSSVMGAFGPSPLALLMFYDPQAQSALDPYILRETFGLTPAEARVAVQLASGRSVKAIANACGTTVETVRAQLRAVFQKTGVNRQSDLVRIITSMPQLQ